MNFALVKRSRDVQRRREKKGEFIFWKTSEYFVCDALNNERVKINKIAFVRSPRTFVAYFANLILRCKHTITTLVAWFWQIYDVPSTFAFVCVCAVKRRPIHLILLRRKVTIYTLIIIMNAMRTYLSLLKMVIHGLDWKKILSYLNVNIIFNLNFFGCYNLYRNGNMFPKP